MRIRDFDTERQVLIVAEIGNNHEGDPRLAEELIVQAAAAGANAVKFQVFRTEHYVSREDPARFARLKRFELGYEQFAHLAAVAAQQGVIFFATPFDLASADFLNTIAPAFKIASGDNLFYPLLGRVAGFGKPIIISSGLLDLAGIQAVIEWVRASQARQGTTGDVAVLHCVTAYPVPPAEANLAALRTLRAALPCTIGYSDHTLGLEAAVLAVAVGARIIEKHFTVDKHHSDFRDHQLSADPADFRELVRRVREAEVLLGAGEKTPGPAEQKLAPLCRRSIVTTRDLPAGTVLDGAALTWVRPAGGLPPGAEDQVLGHRLRRPLPAGARLSPDDVE